MFAEVVAASSAPGAVPGGQITDPPVQPFAQKYSGVLQTQITSISIAIPSRLRAYRDRHGRWVRDAVDASFVKRRMTLRADGEAVWS